MAKGRLVTVQDIHNHPELSKRGILVNQYHDFDNDPLLENSDNDDEKFDSFSSPNDSGREGYEIWEKAASKKAVPQKVETPKKGVPEKVEIDKTIVSKKAETQKAAPKKGKKK